MKVEIRSGILWRLPHEFALCSLQFRLLSGSLLLWGYVNVSYSFRGFAEPESGLARWYSALGAQSQIKVADVVLGLRDISVREVATVTPFAVDGAHSLGFAWRGPF